MTEYHQSFSPAQLDVIKKTCAPDTNTAEFDYFIETAKLYGLNPLKRQIMAMVFGAKAKDQSKRRMSLIVEIGGLRAIAARSGRYRPASEPTIFEEGEKSTTNPAGLSRAIVTIYIKDDREDWFPVIGEAWWDEHVNTKDEWVENQKTGKQILADTWQRMPKLMLAKCAEAQALRKGWPEDLGGLYEQAESGGAWDEDMLPTQALEQHAAAARQKMIGRINGEYAIQFELGQPIRMVPPGKMYDRIAEHVSRIETIMDLKQFSAANSEVLRRYWADDPGAALDLKKMMEKREEAIAKEGAEA